MQKKRKSYCDYFGKEGKVLHSIFIEKNADYVIMFLLKCIYLFAGI